MLSATLMIEYEAVLKRPDHLQAAGLALADVDVLLDAMALVARPVARDFLWRPLLPDSNDNMVLETAVNGQADAIVTFNLRDLRRAEEWFSLVVLTPGKAVRRLERQS